MPRTFLTKHDEPTELVRCPVHGFIHFSLNEREIIDHWAFQRLRNIRQLALCYYVYPGAMHTRFEHSLGVMEMASRAFDTIVRKHSGWIKDELAQIPELKEDTLAKAKQVLRLYALLHDVGHGAFSHAAEEVTPGGSHEAVSAYVLRTVLKRKLDNTFFKGITHVVARLLESAPELMFIRRIVEGEMDMDRTDYLIRDSLHCGVEYGKFDFRRLLESLTVIRNPDTRQLEVAIERGGEHTFEALILARYQMNTQVYYHRLRRIYDYYLTQYMTLWGRENYKTMDDVLRFDDLQVLVEIAEDAKGKNERTPVARRIVERKHHKIVYETSDSADTVELNLVKRILRGLESQFRKTDFYLDDNAKGIHKLTTRGQQDGSTVDFFIVQKDGSLRLITDASAILEKIPTKFRTVRIYADGTPDRLAKIRKAARDLERAN